MKTQEQIKQRIKERGLNQRDVALRIDIPFQNFSAFLNGRREIPLRETLLLDEVLGFPKGHIQQAMLEEKINLEQASLEQTKFEKRRRKIIKTIKENGGFWSYDHPPYKIDDDTVIEEGLQHLEFEDMHLIFENWSKSHVKRIWKQRLVSQGKRMNILNNLLGVLFFETPISCT